jgi:hypothetical protein
VWVALLIWLLVPDGVAAALPDGRAYEMITPVAKNGLTPYAAIPSLAGEAVDFQARGAFAGATAGSLSLYQATRNPTGWQTTPLTPTPTRSLGSLEEQAPVWLSSDLRQTIFTTPETYAAADADSGSLSLYRRDAHGGLTLLSQGLQGNSEPKQATFDGATPDGSRVVFSSGASLLPSATGLGLGGFPEPEYLYEREPENSQTWVLSLDSSGAQAGSTETTLAANYTPGNAAIVVTHAEGFFPGQFITVGGETTQLRDIPYGEGPDEELVVGNGSGLPNPHPAGTPVAHAAEGSILGNGGHLASGASPAGEYAPANAGSGSTTNAISNDGSKVFFESPNPASIEPVGLYMRLGISTTVKIAGATPDGSTISGGQGEARTTFGSARYEGATADGSLAFFTSEEGLAGATNFGTELYEFNTTNHEMGSVPAMSVHQISGGLKGDQAPRTTIAPGGVPDKTTTIYVTSTTGFQAGETLVVSPFGIVGGKTDAGLVLTIASINSATELTVVSAVHDTTGVGIPEGTEVHGVHPAAMTAAANDGSRVYFISNGVLAANANAEHATATPMRPNLYVFNTSTDETTFIATVVESDVQTPEGTPTGLAGEPDISRPAIPTPDGGMLVFASSGDLTGQNPWQDYTEIYRYTVAGNNLECLSCTARGVKPTGNANFGETAGGTYDPPGLTSPISEDGSRVFFDTPDSLVPEDTNGSAPQSAKFGTPTSTDVYEAEGGKVYLLSSGKATTPTVLQGTTPSGNDVLFTTTAKLAPQDTDGGYENVWDARVGGGFAAEAGGGQPSCVGASCRAAFGVAPVFSSPASTTPQSAGNPPATVVKPKPKPLICRKGLVKRRAHGKVICARKSSRSATGTGHGASRAVALRLYPGR